MTLPQIIRFSGLDGPAQLLMAALLLTGSYAYGQQSDAPAADAETTALPAQADSASNCLLKDGVGCLETAEQNGGRNMEQPVHVSAIDGSGIVALNTSLPRSLSLQFSTIGGYDTAVLDKQGLGSGFTGGQAAITKSFTSERSTFLLQDAVNVTSYLSQGPTTVALNQLSAALSTQLSQTWSLQASAFTSYGNDSLRAVAPIQQVPIGSASGVVSEAASYGLYTGNVFTGQGTLSLYRQLSARSSLAFSISESNLRYSGIDSAKNTMNGRVEYLHLATRDLTYGVYGIGIRQSGSIDCMSAGGGGEVTYRPSRQLELSGSGGPVSGSGNCAHSLQILSQGSASVRPGKNTAIYFSADHHPNNGVLPQAQWITTLTGGVVHTFNQTFQASSNYALGYGAASTGSPSLHENYIDANLNINLVGGVWETMSFRHYTNSGFAANPDRTIALFTLWWTPGHLRRNGPI